MPQPIPPAAAPIIGATNNDMRGEAAFSSVLVLYGTRSKILLIASLPKFIAFSSYEKVIKIVLNS